MALWQYQVVVFKPRWSIAAVLEAWGFNIYVSDLICFITSWSPADSQAWVVCLLMLSPLVLAPLCWRFAMESEKGEWKVVDFICVMLLVLSFPHHDLEAMFRPNGYIYQFHGFREHDYLFLRSACAVPWFLLQLRNALLIAARWKTMGFLGLAQGCIDVTRIFPAIGAAWLVANRANWTPWNFDPLIVLLTAAHFHHAGFTLPLMAGLNAKASPGCWTRFSCVAILLGVPLVAIGITCTHFGALRFVEPFGVTVLVLGALGVSVSQMRRGLESERSLWARVGFVISGVSLLAAMLLALGFGLRYVFPNLALTMPQMWMIHGTLNAFGFGLCGILAWRSRSKSARSA